MKKNERGRVMQRPRKRQFESVEKDLHTAFDPIPLPPQVAAEPNWHAMLGGRCGRSDLSVVAIRIIP